MTMLSRQAGSGSHEPGRAGRTQAAHERQDCQGAHEGGADYILNQSFN
jgi:hypothetical protein